MKSILFLSVIAFSGACVDQLDTGPEVASTNEPRLASNGLTPAQIPSTTLNQAALTGSAITSLAATSDGRNYLTYLVGCALDGTQSLTTTGSPSYTFTGSLGIVPGWTTTALSTADRHWVSACMLARANYNGSNVQISMRGTHSQLYLSGESGYGLQEAAFYGDIFSGTDTRHTCGDVDTILHPTILTLKLRLCGRDTNGEGPGGHTPCGFIYDGACATTCSFSSPNYTSCTAYDSTVWNEVVKVELLGTI